MSNPALRQSQKEYLTGALTQTNAASDSLDAIIGRLIDIRGAVSRYSASIKNAMAPTSTLPVEVLANIFEQAVHSSKHPLDRALSISHTVSFWRSLSLDLPSLWQAIASKTPFHIKEEVQRVCKRAIPTYTEALALSSNNEPVLVVQPPTRQATVPHPR